MHTLETAMVLPILFLIIGGGLFLCLQTVTLIDKQVAGYAQTEGMDAADCAQVYRITEAVYEIID